MSSADAVLTVGDGRGFVVEGNGFSRFVITAAHCLPHLPPANLSSFTEERTFKSLLGPLSAKPSIWAECLFADPIADIAVLCSPDNQELPEEAERFDELVEAATALAIAAAGNAKKAQVLSLNAEWLAVTIEARAPWLMIAEADKIASRMSGSPIINTRGEAVGLISTSGTAGSLNPLLIDALPPRILA